MFKILLTLELCLAVFLSSASQAATLNGNAFVLRSTGSASGSNWRLDRNGYLGTYLTLTADGNVTVNIQAEGTANGGVNPQMGVALGDSLTNYSVKSGANTYSKTYAMKAGTYFLRTEFNNDPGATSRQLQVDKVTVTGATISNTNSDANALAASDSYVANYRRGNVTVGGFTPGQTVNVSQSRLGFNWGAAVQYGVDADLGSAGTTEQVQYQKYLNQNFNALVAATATWQATEVTQNHPDMSEPDEVSAYGKAHNMPVTYHELASDPAGPTWEQSLAAKAGKGSSSAKTSLRNAISSRNTYYIAQRANTFNEVIPYNESYWYGAKGGSSTLWNLYGASGVASIYNDAVKAITAAGSKAKAYTNDDGALNDAIGDYANFYTRHVESIQQAGVNAGYGKPVTGMAMELYEKVGLDPHLASKFIKDAQNLDVEGLPLSLSEWGVFTNASMADSGTMLGQAMRMAFGNPNFTSFNIWDWQKFGDGSGQFSANGALYTVSADNVYTLTPAGQAWQANLAQWTTQLTATADANGVISFNGYYGDYKLTAGSKNYALTLTKGTSAYTVGSSLSISAVPEPNTIALLLIGGGVLVICRAQQGRQITPSAAGE
jgi:hypothetical protein